MRQYHNNSKNDAEMTQILENDSLRLRAPEPYDIDILMKWENDTSLWDYGDTLTPYSRHQIANFIKNYDGDIFSSKQLRFIIEEHISQNVVGTIDLYDFDFFNSRVAVGILIEKNYRQLGYATQALSLTVKYAEEFLGIHQCYAIIPEFNTASINLFESCNFKSSGKLYHWFMRNKSWHDALIMQHIK